MRHILSPLMVCLLVLGTCSPSMAQAGKEVEIPGSEKVTVSSHLYKTVGDVRLEMQQYAPPQHDAKDKRPAIVFFFGGGWSGGSVKQFEKQATYFATRGMVAFTADYRVASRHKVTPDKCVMDAKSAIRWVRAHAKELGVDPDRIVAAGGSAGGHIAACTGITPGYDEESEDKDISSIPNAMVLFNPVLDTSPQGWGDEKRGAGLVARFGTHAKALSPQQHVKKGQPPTLVIHGKKDTTVPYAQATAFRDAMVKAGNRCEVAGYDDQGHGFFNHGRGDNSMFLATTLAADKFLQSLHYLQGPATLEPARQR